MNRYAFALALAAALAGSGCADSTATTAPTAVTLSALVLSSSTVAGGAAVTGVLTLTGAAPAGGAAVTLASSSTTVTVPASVTIPAGSNTQSFPMTTTAVAGSTTITATYASASQTATLVTTVVVAPALQGVVLSAPVSMAGMAVRGTVMLTAAAPSGGLTVTLSSSNPLAAVPAAVVVPSGNTLQTFSIEVAASAVTSSATITAVYAGVARTAALTIGQLALSVSATSVPGGLTVSGLVSLPAPAPDTGALVALSSSSPSAIVPATMTIPAGAMSQAFTIATVNLAPTRVVTISAAYGGITQAGTLSVVAYPNVVAVTCTTTTPAAGTIVSCTGMLDGASPSGGWQLAVTSSDASVTVPAVVTVPASSQAFQFSMTTGTVSAVTSVVVRIADGPSDLTLWNVGLSVSP